MSSPEQLYITRLTVARELAEQADALLELAGITDAGRWDKAEDSITVFEIFSASDHSADQAKKVVRSAMESAELPGTLETGTIANRNWQDMWKDYFHVERVSRRIVIKPSHEDYTPQPDDCLIEIDPGMSFGTGQHATTRSCLCFLDKLADILPAQERSFLDLGCGSGILSIAAVKLGFKPVTAFDIDPDSVKIAGDNLAANGTADLVDVSVGNVAELDLTRKYTVTAANILAKILIPYAENITSTVTPGGYLMLAGILTEQFDDVSTIYSRLGFKELERLTDDEWTGGLFIKEG